MLKDKIERKSTKLIGNRIAVEKMTYEDFKSKVMIDTRNEHHQTLIEDWEKNIIFKDFQIGRFDDFYANIYFAKETYNKVNPYSITIHHYSYHEAGKYYSFYHDSESLYKEEIQAIARLENIFTRNNNRFFDCILDKYHENSDRKNRFRISERSGRVYGME